MAVLMFANEIVLLAESCWQLWNMFENSLGEEFWLKINKSKNKGYEKF